MPVPRADQHIWKKVFQARREKQNSISLRVKEVESMLGRNAALREAIDRAAQLVSDRPREILLTALAGDDSEATKKW